MVTQEDVELAYQEAMMNMARLNRTGMAGLGPASFLRRGMGAVADSVGHSLSCAGFVFFFFVLMTLLTLFKKNKQREELAISQIWPVTDYTTPSVGAQSPGGNPDTLHVLDVSAG